MIWSGGTGAAFNHALWLPVVNPMIALGVASFATLLFRYGFVDRQRRRIQAAFRHYLSPALVNQLAANPHRLQLGGENRTITVMFSDIRGFTAISEQFKANPKALSRLINRGFLTPMTRLIMARDGTIDKYIGDCIMAMWNAPLDDPEHANHACDSALAMRRELDRINRDLAAEARAESHAFQPLQIGVGINSGECVVGNMGSEERFAYTAMGDAVNLASRLDGQSKAYRVGIVVGEATRQAAPAWAALELDLIAVRGKQEAVRIYALLGDAELAASAPFLAHARRHEEMLSRYRARDWLGAREALAECRDFNEELGGVYALYAERIAYFMANPPNPDWNGVFAAETK
jgi:adenylate cyclase